jgi:ribosomal protein L37E
MEINRENIINMLDKREANRPCHRCGKTNFSLLDKYSNIFLNENVNGDLHIGGPTVPVAIVVCNNCGAITFHAIGALGLLPPQDEVQTNG